MDIFHYICDHMFKEKIINLAFKIGWRDAAKIFGLTEKSLLNMLFIYNYHAYLKLYKNLIKSETLIIDYYHTDKKVILYHHRPGILRVNMELYRHLVYGFNLKDWEAKEVITQWVKENYDLEGFTLYFEILLPKPPINRIRKLYDL